MNQERFLTPDEVARRWRIPTKCVLKMVRDGALAGHAFNQRVIRIPESAVVDYEKWHNLTQPAQVAATRPNYR